MKMDRFVKVMLVIIAGLLFLNCVKDVSFNSSNSPTSRNDSTQSPSPKKTSFIETSVDAAPVPSFIQKGKTYNCDSISPFTVLEIDTNSGWVLAKGSFNSSGSGEFTEWVNFAGLRLCSEAKSK